VINLFASNHGQIDRGLKMLNTDNEQIPRCEEKGLNEGIRSRALMGNKKAVVSSTVLLYLKKGLSEEQFPLISC